MSEEFTEGMEQDGTGAADAGQDAGQVGADAGQMGQEGQQQQQTQAMWYDGLDADFKNHPSVKKFNNLNDFAKSYLGLDQMIGKEKIVVPKDENDKAAWDIYRKAFNVPENAAKYDLKIEGVEDTQLEGFKNLAFESKLSNADAQKLAQAHIDGIHAYEAAKQQSITEEGKAVKEALNKEWGVAAEKNWALGRKVFEKFCTSADQAANINTELGNNPHFIKFLHNIGTQISEGGFEGFGGQGQTNYTLTPAQAQAELDKIINDPSHAYWAGTKNKRNDFKYCKQNGQSFVSEDERKQAVQNVQMLTEMAIAAQS